MVVIRFNPDSYTDIHGKKIPSCFKVDSVTGMLKINNKKAWNDRLAKLKQVVLNHIQNIPEKEITIDYLFYNE